MGPKNAGYAFLSFRNRAMMERFAECVSGKRLSVHESKPIVIRLGSLRNLAGAMGYFDSVDNPRPNADIFWMNQSLSSLRNFERWSRPRWIPYRRWGPAPGRIIPKSFRGPGGPDLGEAWANGKNAAGERMNDTFDPTKKYNSKGRPIDPAKRNYIMRKGAN